VLAEVLTGPRDPERLPSQLIRPSNGKLLFLLDEAAAAKLPAASEVSVNADYRVGRLEI
jgi:6-phosphogluconolactonase